MALTAQSTASSNWGRWPQQLSGDYAMMESQNMMPFDSRTTSSAPLQRSIVSPYMVHGSYSSAPMSSMTAPHYQAPTSYQFGGYHGPPTPPHHSSPFKQDYAGRRAVGSGSDSGRGPSHPRDNKLAFPEQAPSPARSDSQASTSKTSNPVLTSKTITSNQTLNPEHEVHFDTEVDELMKAIQRKADKLAEVAQPLTPGMSPISEHSHETGTPAPADGKVKRYVCNGPSCNKSFTQKTHLDIHRRTHTGDKPYFCDFPECKQTFSQLGNLKTHVRRHTGERPYQCNQCGRRFAQRGNVRAHEQTHQGLKPFVCKLDGCEKTFSQLGNMKTHQNNFHKATLKKLTSRFSQIIASGEDIPESELELLDYFATHYKNSNKGIKGRGKDRNVAGRKPKAGARSPVNNSNSNSNSNSTTSNNANTTPTPQYSLPQIPAPQQQMPPSHQQHHGLSHPGSLAAYSMSRGQPNIMNNMPREHHNGGYEMFEMHGEHHQVQHANNGNGMMYDDEHTRGMTFGERMY